MLCYRCSQVEAAIIDPPARRDEIQDLTSSKGMFTTTNQELRRIVPDAKGRTVVSLMALAR